jgi:hypothetical protein
MDPQFPQYPPYQPQPYGYQPPVPQYPGSMKTAVVFMYVGGGLELVGFALNLVAGAVSATAVGALIGAGLWFWMASANRAGKNWARITSTVFFALDCIALLSIFALASKVKASAADILIASALVQWLIGLGAIVFLWQRASSAYFAARNAPRY